MEARLFAETNPTPVVESNTWLCDELEALASHPHESLITMQAALSVKVAERMGFDDDLLKDDPDTFRAMKLSPAQYESIKYFEDLVSTLR